MSDNKKTIETLVQDMYGVFLNPEHTISEENLEQFGEDMKASVLRAIQKASEPRVPTLRMSVIGKPNRQLWFELTDSDVTEVVEFGDVDVFEPEPHKYIKFLYGDLIENLMVFLIKESGHSITHAQEEMEIDGVLGHTDGVIDGVPSDIKSASAFAFQHKFKLGGLLRGGKDRDPFGYVGQLSAYRQELLKKYPEEINKDTVAWLVMNKETGELFLLKADEMDLINPDDRIEEIKDMLEKDTPPPELCYPEEPAGTSGNMKINKSCGYCPHKEKCFASANDGTGLRKFQYSGGKVEYLSKVVKTPRVEEIV